MKQELILREFQKKDTPAIEDIIMEAWHYNDLCSPKTARKLASVFLSSCLANQTYTQVAIAGGIPVGVIMAKDTRTHTCPARYRLKQALAIASLFLSREGRHVSKIFSSVNEIDNLLLEECQRKYQGELAFFAVSSSARGTGIGKKLFDAALSYMQAQQIGSFFLFTDTSCNYGFYEHQGLKRRCEKANTFFIDGKKEHMTFYLYDYPLTEAAYSL